jgi:hypothetical protein
MPLLGLQHAGKELLDQDQMRGKIDFEDPVAQLGVGLDQFGTGGYEAVAIRIFCTMKPSGNTRDLPMPALLISTVGSPCSRRIVSAVDSIAAKSVTSS